jgi:hypothetical protein
MVLALTPYRPPREDETLREGEESASSCAATN